MLKNGVAREKTNCLLLSFAASVLALPGIATAAAAPLRPANVPASFVSTPGGWIDPSCIHQVPDGATVDGEHGDITLNGTELEHYETCPQSGISIAHSGLGGPGTYGGWVEDVYQYSPAGTVFGQVTAEMVVPNAPTQWGATVYYFDGLQSSVTSGCGIIQPVLQWGTSPAGGGDYWTVGAWWWSHSGAMAPALSLVWPGDIIELNMGATRNGITVQIIDAARSLIKNATYVTSSGGIQCQWNWAFPAVMKVDTGSPLTNCQQAPQNVANIHGIQLLSGTYPYFNFLTYVAQPEYPIGSNTLGCGFGIGSDLADVVSPQYNNGTSATLWSTALWSTGIASPRTGSSCGYLPAGNAIVAGDVIQSCDGRFALEAQTDGNLVLYQSSSVLWTTYTNYNPGGAALVMQNDGNLVLYDKNANPLSGGTYGSGQTTIYAPAGTLPAGTYGSPADYLKVQNDGNVVVYNSSNVAIWATNTCCH